MKNDNKIYILGGIVCAIFIIATIALAFTKEVPAIVTQGYAALTSAFLAVIFYFFGSSSGSTTKTDVLSKVLNTNKLVDSVIENIPIEKILPKKEEKEIKNESK